jgi:hypothetical protein
VPLRVLLSRAAAVIVLAGSLASAVAAWRGAAARPPDPVGALEAEFRALARVLPPTGAVGFLKYYEDDGRADHIRVYYVAQYALAPRLVVKRTDPAFLIVAPGASRPGGDERLQGFHLIVSSNEGYHLYQRRAP